MQELKHGIEFTFNWWYFLAAWMFAVMAVHGWNRYTSHEGKVYRRKGALRRERIIALGGTILVLVLVIKESHRGLLQVFYNNIEGPGSEVIVILLGGFMITIAIGCYFYLLLQTAEKFARAKRRKIMRDRYKYID